MVALDVLLLCLRHEVECHSYICWTSSVAPSLGVCGWVAIYLYIYLYIIYCCIWSVALAKSIVPRKTWRKLWHSYISKLFFRKMQVKFSIFFHLGVILITRISTGRTGIPKGITQIVMNTNLLKQYRTTSYINIRGHNSYIRPDSNKWGNHDIKPWTCKVTILTSSIRWWSIY
jgi:hypothetical protein